VIEVWCPHVFGTKTREITVAEIIRDNENDIGKFRRRDPADNKRENKGRKKPHGEMNAVMCGNVHAAIQRWRAAGIQSLEIAENSPSL
jgi:hypothetical protein